MYQQSFVGVPNFYLVGLPENLPGVKVVGLAPSQTAHFCTRPALRNLSSALCCWRSCLLLWPRAIRAFCASCERLPLFRFWGLSCQMRGHPQMAARGGATRQGLFEAGLPAKNCWAAASNCSSRCYPKRAGANGSATMKRRSTPFRASVVEPMPK